MGRKEYFIEYSYLRYVYQSLNRTGRTKIVKFDNKIYNYIEHEYTFFKFFKFRKWINEEDIFLEEVIILKRK